MANWQEMNMYERVALLDACHHKPVQLTLIHSHELVEGVLVEWKVEQERVIVDSPGGGMQMQHVSMLRVYVLTADYRMNGWQYNMIETLQLVKKNEG